MKATDYTDFVHTGLGTLAGEFLRRFWHPVARAEDLAPGEARPVRLMGEDFTLYRGESGAPHLLPFRCAHRGAQLSTGWVEGEDLRCIYHGWKYDGSGQCVEQPAEPQPFCQQVRLRAHPVAEYLGLIFVYIGEHEPPLLPRHPEFEEPGFVAVARDAWPCNYFQAIENSVDQAHIAFVHRDSSFNTSGVGTIPSLTVEESQYGITTYGIRPGGSVRVGHWHMPHTNQIKQPIGGSEPGWMDLLSYKVPIDDAHCALFVVYFVPRAEVSSGEAFERIRARLEAEARARTPNPVPELGERVIAGDLRSGDIDVPANIKINLQDYIAQIGQGRIADRKRDRLGRSDAGVILLRKIWTRELQALAEGRPLKRWCRPERLLSTTGV
jgi:5,5'-dehydrodivanillate O-demethylase